MKLLFNRIQVEIDHPIVRIRSDGGREFDNVDIDFFCEPNGIKHEFSTPRTPQQNEVAKRKNRVLQEIGRVMIDIHDTFMQF